MVCKECKIDKDLSEFYLRKNGKVRSLYCKLCYNIRYKKPYNREYYEKNKEIFSENYKEWSKNNDRSEYGKKYRQENKEILREKNKKYRSDNKELILDRKKNYWKNLSIEEKKRINERKKELYHKNNYKDNKSKYVNNKLENDSYFKLKFNIRSLIRNAFKRNFTTKSKKTIEILGCSFEEFKIYLETKFDDKMNWENQGTYWHMDHIIPISSAETEEDVYRLNHYTNFQPLFWLDNLKKSNKNYEINI
jgi:hypothetical protein